MSFKHNIFRALRLYYTSALQDFLKIVLGGESAFVRTPGCNSGGIHVRLVCLHTGESHLHTSYACRPLHRLDMRHRPKELLQQAKITLRLGPFQPQMSYHIRHGQSGQSIQLSPLNQPVTQQKWTLRTMELRPEKLFHFMILLASKVHDCVRHTRRQVQIRILRTVQSAQLSILRIRELPTQHKGLSSHNVSNLTQFLLHNSHRTTGILGFGVGLLQVLLLRSAFSFKNLLAVGSNF